MDILASVLSGLVSGVVGVVIWYKLGGMEKTLENIKERLDRNKIF